MNLSALTRVRNLETKENGTVVDILSSQFTVDYDDGTFGFLMFKYRGIDWEEIPARFCYCSIGAGGKPCISREYCDNNKNRVFKENNNDPHHRKQ